MGKFIDLFAGAGGLSEGFIRAGFEPIAHVEMNRNACETIKTRTAFHKLKKRGQTKIYESYLKDEISNIDNSEKALEYILKLNSLCLKGTVIWDALNIFIKPEHSNNEISIHEKQIIEKGYNYFFRLKGTISFSFLETINNLLDIIDQKYDLDEIIKLSNRVTKKFPDLLEMHNKLIQMSQDELLHLMNSKKIQKSKSKSKYEKAIKAITLNNLNYNELTLDNLRYLGWALGF